MLGEDKIGVAYIILVGRENILDTSNRTAGHLLQCSPKGRVCLLSPGVDRMGEGQPFGAWPPPEQQVQDLI